MANPITSSAGVIRWRNKIGHLHRDDGPAMIFPDGSQFWYSDGVLHRDDGPAVTKADGSQSWYSGGWLHRDDGPAVTKADGSQSWFIYGKQVDPLVAFVETQWRTK